MILPTEPEPQVEREESPLLPTPKTNSVRDRSLETQLQHPGSSHLNKRLNLGGSQKKSPVLPLNRGFKDPTRIATQRQILHRKPMGPVQSSSLIRDRRRRVLRDLGRHMHQRKAGLHPLPHLLA